MKFITVTDAKDGQRRAIRADLILQMNAGVDSDSGKAITFLLLDKTGYSRPIVETPDEVVTLISAAAEV